MVEPIYCFEARLVRETSCRPPAGNRTYSPLRSHRLQGGGLSLRSPLLAAHATTSVTDGRSLVSRNRCSSLRRSSPLGVMQFLPGVARSSLCGFLVNPFRISSSFLHVFRPVAILSIISDKCR